MSGRRDVGLRGYVAFYGRRALELAPGVVVLRAPEAPASPMLNRAVGLGAAEPATERLLDRALDTLGEAAAYVAVEPGARPAELEDWLAARGLEPGWGWMQLERGPEPPPPARTDLRVRVAGPELGAALGRVLRIGFGLPEATEPWLSLLPNAAGWTCWLAFAGDEPAAAGALYVEGDAAYLGFGATLPEHRGRGGQSALLAARIEHARAAGCRRLATETGERREWLPSNSYRNLLRAGLRERRVVRHWLTPSP